MGGAWAARADVVARLEEMEDPEEVRSFMRSVFLGVRQRYLNDVSDGVAIGQRSVVPSDAEDDKVVMSARSLGERTVVTIMDAESIRSFDETGESIQSFDETGEDACVPNRLVW